MHGFWGAVFIFSSNSVKDQVPDKGLVSAHLLGLGWRLGVGEDDELEAVHQGRYCSLFCLSLSVCFCLYLSFCLCLYLSLFLSLCLFLSLILFISLSLFLSVLVSISFSLCLSFNLCLCLSVTLLLSVCLLSVCLYRCRCLSVCLFLSFCLFYLCLYVSVSLSLSISQSVSVCLSAIGAGAQFPAALSRFQGSGAMRGGLWGFIVQTQINTCNNISTEPSEPAPWQPQGNGAGKTDSPHARMKLGHGSSHRPKQAQSRCAPPHARLLAAEQRRLWDCRCMEVSGSLRQGNRKKKWAASVCLGSFNKAQTAAQQLGRDIGTCPV